MSTGPAAGPGSATVKSPPGPSPGGPAPGAAGTRATGRYGVQDNARLAKEMLEAFNHGDLEGALGYLDPQVTLRSIRPGVGRSLPRQGREALRSWALELVAGGLRPVLDLGHIRAAGGVVVALGHIHLEGDPAEEVRTVPCRWVMKFREGLVADIQVFSDAPVPRQSAPGAGR